ARGRPLSSRGHGQGSDCPASSPGSAVANDFPVQRVTLDRYAAGFLNQAANLRNRELLGGGASGIEIDLFVHHGAINVVRAERKGDLGRLDAEHHPVRLDVRDIVKHEATDGHDAQVHKAAGLLNVREPGMLRMKRRWNKSLEAPRFVLKLAKAEQVV